MQEVLSPSPNVGEFDVLEIIFNLPRVAKAMVQAYRLVNLVLPLTAETPVEILLPSPLNLKTIEFKKAIAQCLASRDPIANSESTNNRHGYHSNTNR